MLATLTPVTKAASALSPEAAVSSARLHGLKPPATVIQKEKTWHYAAALMMAAGSVTAQEVAEAFNVTPQTINNLVRQPWFQEQVTTLMREHGGRDIMELFRAETFNSLVTLTELRDNAKVPAAVRRASASDILDRALGKALQRNENVNNPTSSDPVSEVARLESGIKNLSRSSDSQ